MGELTDHYKGLHVLYDCAETVTDVLLDSRAIASVAASTPALKLLPRHWLTVGGSSTGLALALVGAVTLHRRLKHNDATCHNCRNHAGRSSHHKPSAQGTKAHK